jgi:hypothetical protein
MRTARKTIQRTLLTFIAFSLLSVVTVQAASDGDLGEDSTGTSDITLTIPELIRISGVGDIALGTFSGDGNMNGFDTVCIFRNNPDSPNYSITATDSNNGPDFKVEDDDNEITYQVYWNDETGIRGAQLDYNTALPAQGNANTSSTTCSGGFNARFDVEILEADLIAAVPGSYSATLTLFVEPE